MSMEPIPLEDLTVEALDRARDNYLARETTPVPACLLQGLPRLHFVLRVEGEALKEQGILAGDLLLVLRHHEPVEGDLTVRRLWVAMGHLACEEAEEHVPALVGLERPDSWCLACGAPMALYRWRVERGGMGEPEGVVLALIRTYSSAALPLETVEVVVGGVV